MRNTKPEIGFIGLGIMGGPMAKNLQKAGFSLHICDYDESALKALADTGARIAKSGKDVAEAADIIIIMVPDTPHVEAVLFGDQGVATGLTKGQ